MVRLNVLQVLVVIGDMTVFVALLPFVFGKVLPLEDILVVDLVWIQDIVKRGRTVFEGGWYLEGKGVRDNGEK